MKSLIYPIIGIGALAVACTGQQTGSAYKVSASTAEEDNGKMAYLVNYDNGEKIDSVIIADRSIAFDGTLKSL